MTYLWVFVMGGLGAVSRVAVSGLLPARPLPVGTLLVNVLGCLLIGAVFALVESRPAGDPMLRRALAGGFLGGFTTFSAFGLETWELLQEGQWPAALAYSALSLVVGLMAVAGGVALVRSVS